MSPTLVNLVKDHGFISEEYYLNGYEAFWESPKQSHESLHSKWIISYPVREGSSNREQKPCGELCSTNENMHEH